MRLSKKTTALFPRDLHDHLVQLAQSLGVSFGELVRRACEAQYGVVPEETKLDAVRELAKLDLPVGSISEMKRQSVPDPDDVLP